MRAMVGPTRHPGNLYKTEVSGKATPGVAVKEKPRHSRGSHLVMTSWERLAAILIPLRLGCFLPCPGIESAFQKSPAEAGLKFASHGGANPPSR